MSALYRELERMDRETLEKMKTEIQAVLDGKPLCFDLQASEEAVPCLEVGQLLKIKELDRPDGRVTVEVWIP